MEIRNGDSVDGESADMIISPSSSDVKPLCVLVNTWVGHLGVQNHAAPVGRWEIPVE
jgi:hypothetical protein